MKGQRAVLVAIVLGFSCAVGTFALEMPHFSFDSGGAKENSKRTTDFNETREGGERLPIFQNAYADEFFQLELSEKTGLIGYFTLESGPSWLNIEGKGKASGFPTSSYEGINNFLIKCKKLSGEEVPIELTVNVLCSSG